MNSEDYIKKWLDGTLSDTEREAFEASQDYRMLKKLTAAVRQFKAPDYNVAQELSRLNRRKSNRHRAKTIKVSWMQMALRVAAVVVVTLIGYYFIFAEKPIVVSTGIAEKTEVHLPDNSVVELNAESSLTYSKENWQQARQVKLTGEAFFAVAKGAKFEVLTADGIVTVLGTRFNVKARNNYFEVICYEGLVSVSNQKATVKLPAGNMFRIIDGKLIQEANIKAAAPGWLTNESAFVSVPFKYIIEEIERQYDVTVTTRKVDTNQLFTGRFTHKNLELALMSISQPLNLQYKLVGEQQIELTGASQ